MRRKMERGNREMDNIIDEYLNTSNLAMLQKVSLKF